MPKSNRVLRLPEVLTVCGLSRSSIYLKIKQGGFPPPIKLGERFTQRVELFNWWGEQLAAAQHGAKIITLSGEAYDTA